jgi:hypothetical protein
LPCRGYEEVRDEHARAWIRSAMWLQAPMAARSA